MSLINEAKQMLLKLESKSTFEKMVQVAAILTKLLEDKHIRPVIVGGLAVEIYTRSDYTTVDIDKKIIGSMVDRYYIVFLLHYLSLYDRFSKY